MGKRWIAALAACGLLFGFAACGGDDDDDVAADEGAEEQAEVDDAKAAFCADLDDTSEGEEPIENLEASSDLAVAAQTATETQEQSDALQLMADFATFIVDNDDGDGVVTDPEISAALAEFPTLEDGIAVVSEWCAGSRDSNGDAG